MWVVSVTLFQQAEAVEKSPSKANITKWISSLSINGWLRDAIIIIFISNTPAALRMYIVNVDFKSVTDVRQMLPHRWTQENEEISMIPFSPFNISSIFVTDRKKKEEIRPMYERILPPAPSYLV